MVDKKKIFIGSSKEAHEVAKVTNLVEKVITEAGMEAVGWWNPKAFPQGTTLVEAIESLPTEFDGAVLLWTPDVSYKRGKRSLKAPVANVIFEYGHLAARLTRERVALCTFKNADSPSDIVSDIGGVRFINAGDYMKDQPLALPDDATRELLSWIERLPSLADGIPPTSQVHGYSGRWEVKNRFSLWHEIPVKDHQVFFEGKTFLFLPVNGKGGKGIQIGNLHISIDKYQAKYLINNEITDASVDDKGTLKLKVEVKTRELIKEDPPGDPAHHRFREKLTSPNFEVTLERKPGQSKILVGKHDYNPAINAYSEAKEIYRYLD